MPTRKPRIALALPDDLRAVMQDFADATEQPVSAAIVSLLVEMQPQLVDLAKVIRAARSGQKSAAKRALSHMMGNAFAELAMAQQLPLKGTVKGK
jgi:hypothetical protein